MRPAYCLNGFTDHRLDDALRLLADLGYRGVALTLGPPHLDVGTADRGALTRVRDLCERLGLVRVIETGGRYWLDPRRKHAPTLVSAEGAARMVRRRALLDAVGVAAALGAPVVHCWAGQLEAGVDRRAAHGWLVDGLRTVADAAAAAGIRVAFEPEPGMAVATLAEWTALRDACGRHPALGLTLDLGHVVCLESPPWPEAVAAAAGDILHVQVEDMRPGKHEHLPFGEGVVPLGPMLAALARRGYAGLLAVELPRHAHEAPLQAERSLAALRAAAASAGVTLS